MSKKLIGCAVALAFSAALVTPAVASAATLTPPQISAIISLLQSFGADPATMVSVQTILSEQSAPSFPGHMPMPDPCQFFGRMPTPCQFHGPMPMPGMPMPNLIPGQFPGQMPMPGPCQFPSQMPVPCVVIFHPQG